ncbi:hypothetical protein GZ77_24565 [Endozoicomonas montiporae]|uniref:Lipoprotein n=2 Tax=Endozoicomonas montiporae TaxID=1027273 RepID=A0A081MZR4_9GAMM|nr:hypothetical protein [Endozoicomonas montiporae]AMO54622.1 lipoprotein [Endozoicomonas montiporae CL-33]KEQ11687.1 hypothetical protein GZ77_24565 [Endozoicomonas montiporae]
MAIRSISGSTLILAILAGFLTGCASHLEKEVQLAAKQPDQTDVCGQLNYVFDNSSNGFQAIRTQPDFQNKITLWKSTYQPLQAHCEIWQWANRYSFVCSKVLPDAQSARAIYDETNATIQQCVKPENVATRTEKLPDSNGQKTKGEKTEYLLNGQVRGSSQMVNTKGLFSDDWTVYVLISSPIPGNSKP